MPSPPMSATFKLSAKSLLRIEDQPSLCTPDWFPMWLSEALRVPGLIPPGREQGGPGELFSQG